MIGVNRKLGSQAGNMRLNKAQRKKVKRDKKKVRLEKQARKKAIRTQKLDDSVFSYREPSEWRQEPNLFPDNVPIEKRREIIAEVIEKAKKEFDETFPDLKKWFKEYDSCYILSFYSFYFMSQKQGTTSEHEGDYEHYQHYLEILQAIALTEKRNYESKPLLERAKELEEQLSRLGTLTQFKHLDIKVDDTEEMIGRKGIIAQVRSNTTAVRNWAYYFQMEKATLELMAAINTDFSEKFGVEAEDVASIFFNLPKMINTKFQEHISKVRKVYKQKNKSDITKVYEEQFPDVVKMDKEQSEEMFKALGSSVKRLKQALIFHSDMRLQDIYTFTTDEIIEMSGKELSKPHLRKVLDELSYKFEDLKDQVLEHIILDNPVLKKPFIKLAEDTYFCPIAASLAHFSISIIENMMVGDDVLAEKYSKKKGEYCERYVSDVLTSNFPNAKIYENFKWERSDIPDKVFETDNLLVAESFALVIESKSGKLTPQGRRGAEDRLQRHIDELVLEPSRQATNFITAVKEGKIKNIKDSNGRTLTIDLSGVNYFIPISITLENLGMMSDARGIVKAGMNKELKAEDISLCMTMTDLESVFEILPYETMKLHYLVRRREFAMHVEHMGDEMDLLEFYTEKGFNIGEAEYEAKLHMSLIMHSVNIDKYFMLLDDEPIPPPKTYLTPEWSSLLESLETRRPNGWIEASFALLNCDNEDQVKFNKQANKLLSDFRKGNLSKYPKDPYMVFTTGAAKRRTAILLFPYRNLEREERNDTIANAMTIKELEDCKVKLSFGIDVDKPNQPYAVMAVAKDSVLTEEPVEFIGYHKENQ